MLHILKKKNKLKRELLSKIEWACGLNAIKLEHEMILECCLRIIEYTNLAYVVFFYLLKITAIVIIKANAIIVIPTKP